MKTVDMLRFHKLWFWFTSLFAAILFGYGFLNSLIRLDIWGFLRWGVGFVVYCIGCLVVSKHYFGSFRIKQ